jgi:sRNA-binding carbon storage regulator CsrA
MGHLCITRKSQEQIEIGKQGDVLTGPIIITMEGIEHHGTRARIGIRAQNDIVVNRLEVADKIRLETQRKPRRSED